MTTRSTANLSPSPQLHARSSSSPNQQFPTPRPPLPGTPNRDGRSRTSNSVIQSLNGSASKTDVLTYDNFNEIIIQKIRDPLYNDQLARLNRITSSLSQHVSTLTSFDGQYADLHSQQKSLLENMQASKDSIEQDAHSRLNTAFPQIAEQNRTMENIERRVETARTKLAKQSDMLADIDFRIAENRRLLSLPPPSSQNIISAPPFHSREQAMIQ